MKTIEHLLELLAEHGGEIVSSNDLQPELIEQARASGRMYVDDNHYGYIWIPPFKNGNYLPTNDEELNWLQKWYPIKTDLPDRLKDANWLFDKIRKR